MPEVESDRREFLEGLMRISALPADLKKLSLEDLANSPEAWAVVQANPTVFSVNARREIWLPSYVPPRTHAEAYRLERSAFGTREELVRQVEDSYAFWSVLEGICRRCMEYFVESENLASLDEEDQPYLVQEVMPFGPLELSVERWLLNAPEEDIALACREMSVWAQEETGETSGASDFIAPPSGRHCGLWLFRHYVKRELVTRVGVAITEGRKAGLDYDVAVLERPLDEANEKARAAGLPVRFEREKPA